MLDKKKTNRKNPNMSVLPGSWSGLKRELYSIGQGTPLLGKGHPMTIRDLQQIRYVTPRP
jgi:hypothetical protein